MIQHLHLSNTSHVLLDIGGGNELDGAPASLANIPFRWMLHEIQELDCGVLFDNNGLDKLQIPTDCVRRVPNPKLEADEERVDIEEQSDTPIVIPSWSDADKLDVTAGLHDELKIHPLYWFIQIPTWTGKRWDLTGTRIFPTDAESEGRDSIHLTVLMRMQQGYKPNAKLPQNWKALVAGGV